MSHIEKIKDAIGKAAKDPVKLLDTSYVLKREIFEDAQRRRAFAKRYEFIDRRKNAENLLLILAGFQPYYWDAVTERVAWAQKLFDEPLDVCVCIPRGGGGDCSRLKDICERYSWSYLRIPRNLLAQAQNTAIKLHENAKWIFKIDEDIILCEDYFTRMKAAIGRVPDAFTMKPGFWAPLINLNAFSSARFVQTIGKMNEMEERFGKYLVFDGDDNPSHNYWHGSQEFAQWIWEQSVPFDLVAHEVFEKNEGSLSVCPHRFSIGAILFTREFWHELGYFRVASERNGGVEEEQACNMCMNNSYGILVVEDCFVGHLGFFTQKETCRKFFEQHTELIRLSE